MLFSQALKGKTARIGAAIIGQSVKVTEIPPSVAGNGRVPCKVRVLVPSPPS